MTPPRLDAPFVAEVLDTPAGPVPRASSLLTAADRLGTLRVRLGIGRDDYKVDPGLYALGRPDEGSPVLVTANYKLTFDVLRSTLDGVDAWLLVLNTRGINVWCAAGKATFSTDELVDRLAFHKVAAVVTRRVAVVPQLGAVGVAAHEVRRRSGFGVKYGPVRAEDIPAYLAANMRATPEMRAVDFPLRDRLVLTPVELAGMVKPTLAVVAACLAVALVAFRGIGVGALAGALDLASPYLAGLLTGAVLVPALLPWLPFRMLSAKGAVLGAVAGALLSWTIAASPIGSVALVLISAAVASYVAMNFTGSTPYTSMSGVEREMRRSMPWQAAGLALGLALFVVRMVLR
jgi:hypothetical protein